MIPKRPLPHFSEGLEYRQLHPVREGKKRWRFITLRPIRIRIDGITTAKIHYHDATGKVWAQHDRFGLLISEGYAWNGCSPKRWFPLLGWIGTPDLKEPDTILASLVHDIGYQFGCTEHFPLTREQVDATFYHLMAMTGPESIAGIYHGAVRKFASWNGRPGNGEFSTLA